MSKDKRSSDRAPVVARVFRECVEAIKTGRLIQRVSSTDKEYHFQNWFKQRLRTLGDEFEEGGRNTYPDFRMVARTDGFEIKGLAYPGRDASFDSNSQVPTGFHNGRTIYYVFGRYPKKPDGTAYPVLDLVICHGDFLNADHEYIHQNKSVRGFGSYGDVLIRDRKMYVVPTPFRLCEGVAHCHTLILPAKIDPGDRLLKVGDLSRLEAAQLIIGYSFDLRSNEMQPRRVPNPGAGTEHRFSAWRLTGSPGATLSMRAILAGDAEGSNSEDEDADE